MEEWGGLRGAGTWAPGGVARRCQAKDNGREVSSDPKSLKYHLTEDR